MSDRPRQGAPSRPRKHQRRGIQLGQPSADHHPLDFDAVRSAARGRWPEILVRLGISAEMLHRKHGPCPGCGGTDRFRFDDQDGRGTWICGGGGERRAGDGFELLVHVHGWSHADALHRVADVLGLASGADLPQPAAPPARDESARQEEEAAKHARAAARADAEWSRAVPARDDQPTLLSKRIPPLIARVDTAGRLLLPVYDERGALQSVQRISTDASGKNIKRFLYESRTTGGWCEVQPGQHDAPVAIAECYTDACTLALAAPTWRVICAFSAGQLPAVAAMLRAAEPDRVLFAAADNDTAGLAAARKAADLAAALPLLPPGPGKDWSDLYLAVGLDGLREAIEVARESSGVNPPINPFDSLDTSVQPLRNSFETPSQPLHEETDQQAPAIGKLVYLDDGRKKLRVDSDAAVILADMLRNRLAYDPESVTWFIWRGTHWAPQTTAAPADRLLADAMHDETRPCGFRLGYLNGVVGIITKRGLLPRPEAPRDVVPFLNGMLDLRDMKLRDPSPDYALDWVLPHRYDPEATCPNIRAWMLQAVEGDTETVELLRAWLAALVRGIMLQVFLVLLGRGGSGKGTFQRLCSALIGILNVAISTLRDLEENRFETAKIYGKRFVMVNEAGRHGGSMNMVKALTGGDHVPLERKHQQQSGSFVFTGLMLMASNEEIASSDGTSGLWRRQITVRFPRTATPEERADWRERGGEEGVLHAEIPGLINWLMTMPIEEIRRRIDHPPDRVRADNLLGMAAGSTVSGWLMGNCIPGQSRTPDDQWCTQIGTFEEPKREGGALIYPHADDRLYPNYVRWCIGENRKPLSLVRFAATMIDTAETLGHRLERYQHPSKRSAFIRGLRLRRRLDLTDPEKMEPPYEWLRPKGLQGYAEGVEAAPRVDPKGSKGFSGTFPEKNAEVF